MAEAIPLSEGFDESECARRRETERLGTDRIIPLVLRLSLPAMLGLLVSSLYVFVDRLFVGNLIGEVGLAAMNSVIPFTTFIFAFSILIGRGCAVIYSIALGRRDYQEAGRIFAQGIALDLIISFVLMTIGLSFLPSILRLFGAADEAIGLAHQYMSVSLYGTPFVLLTMQNHLIRSEGASTYAMMSQITGALLNVFLDWLFMSQFGLGIRGAAAATVISQGVTVLLVMHFFARRSVIRFSFRNLVLTRNIFVQVMFNGMTPFLFHFVATLTWTIQNHMIQKYALLSGHPVASAMAAFGIVMSLYHVVMTPVLGLGMGMQPLIGYNIGAGKYRRVRKTFVFALLTAFALALVPYAFLQILAEPVVRLFGAQDDSLRLSVYTLRRYILLMPLGSLVVMFSHYFQGTGQAKSALWISSVRQLFLALPLMILLPHFFGYAGIVFASPIAEVGGMIFGLLLMSGEFARLKRREADEIVVSAKRVSDPNDFQQG